MLRLPQVIAPALIAVLALLSGRAAAQTVQQPPGVLSRVEIGASVSFAQRFDTPPEQRDWTGPGLSLAANRNLNRNVALTAEANTFFDGPPSLLAGTRVRTGFYYGNSRDPVPGRFVGSVLIGSVAVDSGTSHLGMKIGGGADVLFKHPRGMGLHWEVGYRIVPSARLHREAGYVEIGFIVGPRLR